MIQRTIAGFITAVFSSRENLYFFFKFRYGTVNLYFISTIDFDECKAHDIILN